MISPEVEITRQSSRLYAIATQSQRKKKETMAMTIMPKTISDFNDLDRTGWKRRLPAEAQKFARPAR
jgi:hypothetical protein